MALTASQLRARLQHAVDVDDGRDPIVRFGVVSTLVSLPVGGYLAVVDYRALSLATDILSFVVENLGEVQALSLSQAKKLMNNDLAAALNLLAVGEVCQLWKWDFPSESYQFVA